MVEPHVPPHLYYIVTIILICVNKNVSWSTKHWVGDRLMKNSELLIDLRKKCENHRHAGSNSMQEY